jgi:hypothetical protein
MPHNLRHKTIGPRKQDIEQSKMLFPWNITVTGMGELENFLMLRRKFYMYSTGQMHIITPEHETKTSCLRPHKYRPIDQF